MLQLLIGIATALTGGVVAAFVTYRLNATKEHVFHMRRKAEELFLSFDEFDKQVGMHFIGYYPLLRGQIDYEQLLDMQIKEDKNKGEAAANFKMLSSIYFPQLGAEVSAYDGVRTALHELLGEHKRAYKNGDGSGYFPRFHAALGEHQKKSHALRIAIIAEARCLTGIDSLWPDFKSPFTSATAWLQRWQKRNSST
jgi:hypothetical protein